MHTTCNYRIAFIPLALYLGCSREQVDEMISECAEMLEGKELDSQSPVLHITDEDASVTYRLVARDTENSKMRELFGWIEKRIVI